MAPMELRTARRRKGLAEVSPTSRAWTPKATQLRTRPPRFSALDNPSTAARRRGRGQRSRNVSSESGGGTRPIASKPWYIEKPVSVFEQFLLRHKDGDILRAAPGAAARVASSQFSGRSTETTSHRLSRRRRTTFSPSATNRPCSRWSNCRRRVRYGASPGNSKVVMF